MVFCSSFPEGFVLWGGCWDLGFWVDVHWLATLVSVMFACGFGAWAGVGLDRILLREVLEHVCFPR